MSKTYKGYELIKALGEGKIEEGTEFIDNYGSRYITKYNRDLEECELHKIEGDVKFIPDYSLFVDNNFKVLEDEKQIDIDSIEELKTQMILGNQKLFDDRIAKINELIRAVKQINRKLEER